ncbi:MAG: hypothetical protein NZ602_06535 [Thermoguttaceae bacterium]|nr:hypothetical protein [Thermoguttaceae bacterium]
MACEALEGWAGQARAAERPREACGDCGGRMRAQGRPRGYVATTVGVIRLCRQRWRCGGCGRESYPEDRQVRFRLHGVSWQLAKRLSWLGAWAPAEQVWKRLWEDCGVRLSKQTIQQVAYEAGGLFCEQEDGQRRQMVAGGPSGIMGTGIGKVAPWSRWRSKPEWLRQLIGYLQNHAERIDLSEV